MSTTTRKRGIDIYEYLIRPLLLIAAFTLPCVSFADAFDDAISAVMDVSASLF